jgi:Short C-terminal domain
VFGIGSRRLERKLRRHGTAAMATVLSTRRAMSGLYKSDDPFYQSPPTQATPDLWAMTVRVQPDGAPAFDANIEAWLWQQERPWLNTVVPVLYDPSDHRKVVLDRSAEAQKAAQQATFAMRDRWLAEQARNPVDRLTDLMNLRDRGVLTAAEYEEQKRRLLGQ